jgi:hypothetical protein
MRKAAVGIRFCSSQKVMGTASAGRPLNGTVSTQLQGFAMTPNLRGSEFTATRSRRLLM